MLDHEISQGIYSDHRAWGDPVKGIERYTIDGAFANCVRELLIDPDSDIDELADRNETSRILDLHRVREYIINLDRERLTQMLLDDSLCPLHRIDYAICFDDEDEECASIRTIHPDHDS